MATPEDYVPKPENRALIKRAKPARKAPAPMVLQLGNGEEASAGAFSFNLMWQALLQRWRLAAPLGAVLAAAACVALAWFTEAKYKSLATMRIIDKAPALVFQSTEQSQAFAQTQIELLRGPFIISRAIESQGLTELPELREIADKEDPVQWIMKRLKATRTGQSEMYEVSFTTREAESARRVVEAIVDTYMQFQTEITDTQRQNMLEILNEEVGRVTGEIENKRNRLLEMRKLPGDDGVVIAPSADGTGTASAVGRFTQLAALEQQLVST